MSALRASGVARLMKSRGLRSLPEAERTLAKTAPVFLGERLDALELRACDELSTGATDGDGERKIRRMLLASP